MESATLDLGLTVRFICVMAKLVTKEWRMEKVIGGDKNQDNVVEKVELRLAGGLRLSLEGNECRTC